MPDRSVSGLKNKSRNSNLLATPLFLQAGGPPRWTGILMIFGIWYSMATEIIGVHHPSNGRSSWERKSRFPGHWRFDCGVLLPSLGKSCICAGIEAGLTDKHDTHHSQFTANRPGIAWGGQVQDALAEHFQSLAEFPPRQKGGSLMPGGKWSEGAAAVCLARKEKEPDVTAELSQKSP
jgi:hypothetical protein